MSQQTLLRVLAASATISVLAIAPAGDAQVGLERKVVLQQDLKMPGYETIVAGLKDFRRLPFHLKRELAL